MEKCLCKVWSGDRTKKKAFLCQPRIDFKQKAKEYSIEGEKLVLESDGTEIEDDEVLKFFLDEKHTLMILHPFELWTPGNEFTAVEESTRSCLSQNNTETHKSMFTIQQDDATCSNQEKLEEGAQCCFSMQGAEFAFEEECCFSVPDSQFVLEESFPSNTVLSTNLRPTAPCDAFENFVIPWEKMSPELHNAFHTKKKLGKLLNCFSNVVVDELRGIASFIPMRVYKNIAQSAANKYPESFVERDGEGHIMSHSPVSLITTMRNRNNFLNSKIKRNSEISKKPRNAFGVLAKTCVNWQPQTSEERNEDILSKKKYLLMVFQQKLISRNDKENVQKYMLDCFSSQRLFFNNTNKIPLVRDILANWPLIFNKQCLYDNFNKLMQLDVNLFKQNFEASRVKVQQFFKNPEIESDEAMIHSLCTYFNEVPELIFKKYKFGSTIENIKKDCSTLTPWVTIIEISPDKNITCISYMWLEGEITSSEEFPGLVDLLLQLLCYYYIFNIEYPKDASQTLEFLMRYFFKFYPSQLRGKKKTINNLRKINTLIKKLDRAD